MKETKRIIATYPPFDYEGIQKFLEKQALEGWQLEKIGTYTWKFRKSEPRETHYNVVFISTASAYDPYKGSPADELSEYCVSAGWEHVDDLGKLQIFRCDDNAPIPIETDEAIKLENVKKSVAMTYILPMVLLVVLFGVNGNGFIRIFKDPAGLFSSYANLFLCLMHILMAVMVIISSIYFGIWAVRSKRAIERGGDCLTTTGFTHGYRLMNAMIWISILLFMVTFSSENSNNAVYFITYMIAFLAAVALSRIVTDWLRSRGCSRTKTRVLSILFIVVVVVAINAGLIAVVWNNDSDAAGSDPSELPLLIQDIRPVNADDYTYSLNVHETPILKLSNGSQYIKDDADDTESDTSRLEYEILDGKSGWLYDRCLTQWMKDGNGLTDLLPVTEDTWSHFEEIGGSRDGYKAEHVYRYIWYDEPDGTYLFCYPDRIAKVSFLFWNEQQDNDIRRIDEIISK